MVRINALYWAILAFVPLAVIATTAFAAWQVRVEIPGNLTKIHEPATPDRTEYPWAEADWITAASLGIGTATACCVLAVSVRLLVARRRYASARERLDIAQREAEAESPPSPPGE
ncbi:hypothetical protein [Streptomyces sp. SM12]|uniref:hypothetical protein n=1 Tax=Streptomyces sp. SM12 TaxID=1071602 RepID=UPI000CD52AE8|nr:hypothetical protein [Streptomyces sp. SM12]